MTVWKAGMRTPAYEPSAMTPPRGVQRVGGIGRAAAEHPSGGVSERGEGGQAVVCVQQRAFVQEAEERFEDDGHGADERGLQRQARVGPVVVPGRGPEALEDVHLAQPEEVDPVEVHGAVACFFALRSLVDPFFSLLAPLFFPLAGFCFCCCRHGWRLGLVLWL